MTQEVEGETDHLPVGRLVDRLAAVKIHLKVLLWKILNPRLCAPKACIKCSVRVEKLYICKFNKEDL